MSIMITKRNGRKEILDISKIQKNTIAATDGLEGVSQSELEIDAQIKFIDGMSSSDIQDALIKTAVEKIDIDAPNWTFVASRLFLFDLYHRVGKATHGIKGKPYCHLKDYIKYGQNAGRILPGLENGFDLDELNTYIDCTRDYKFNYLGVKTLYDRYLLKNSKGEPIELPQQMFMAIAMFLAQNEVEKTQKAKEFYDVISKFEVMLATPTLSNARTPRHQLSSCYIGSSPDNIEGIFDGYKEMALLSKYGGGIGWDWNSIRALGGVIDNHKNAAGGVIPFLKITNDLALAVDQLGTRKGAIAVYLEPWHMDILDFIDLKKNSGEERRRAHDLFPALWISDLFMKRIASDSHWTLFDPYEVKDLASLHGAEFEAKYEEYENNPDITKEHIKAKDLWKKVLTSYFESGSPFLCFKDNANRSNPNDHTGFIRSSNLCTEIFQNTSPNYYKIRVEFVDGSVSVFDETDDITLDNGITKKANKVTALDTIGGKAIFIVDKEKIDGDTAVCNLASINLSKTNTKEDIQRVTKVAIRMLDNVIDLNFYPLKKVKVTNLKTRAIGLGVMGESQMLAQKGIFWGSNDHFKLIDSIMEAISYNAIKSSSDLALEKGSYPTFEGSKWSKGIMPFDNAPQAVNALVDKDLFDAGYDWESLRTKVKKDGMRNGYLMAIAPTSSISILVGTTQAIEPVYKRKWYEENLSGLIPVVVPELSPSTWQYYTPAYEVEQTDIIKAAAIRQKWIDQGQSVNIFMSLNKASGKYLHEIYTLAWKLGLKSTYYLRSQSPEASNDVEDRSLECVGCQ
ncbi:ribonucleoside-diphosphate reductase subunit alpha [Arcobacter sp. FWKO B]|uniref:ribonucleoside-diphosphate reductase subunit alpha n=1 Tax=Arcobacter sp. FWKO B TaxID=2593672 RepID=UPI0018A5516F|nr:ribonucleoside-diphosphate reductase subunit alpha [Arcobacter sp. FWKO B]QOG12333.1 ribonucleoside-diphosphate reductase subunit alpha [Arcobacter sp. FWKO B]